MTDLTDIRRRFPGLSDGWSRFDGPAGTQAVDTSIEAVADWQRSGNNANSHGAFPAARECDALTDRVSATVGELLGADPAGMVFGPSTTANMMALTRAIAADLGPGDEIICTELDHDSNLAPWLLAARDTGATVRTACLDPDSGRLHTEAVVDLIGPATRWVAVTGASNAIGAIPDTTEITGAAHAAGARVVVDGVHLTPHRRIDVKAIGCDVFTTSSYKWYGPHAGVMWVEPDLLDSLPAYKVRPAPASGPGRFQYGTPSWEAMAGIDAAARFLLETTMAAVIEHEEAVFAHLLAGLHDLPGVQVVGPPDLVDRAPTTMFLVEGHTPLQVATRLADEMVAVWDGHNYAVEAMGPLGLDADDGAVRAGVCIYIGHDDVERLLEAVATLVGH
ncbi:MAG: hypothetical protein MAG471_01397 [Acidimicrobiaceae bacterium]|nr:hypothetical protein [Acidimicrobiaceae bacterium]